MFKSNTSIATSVLFKEAVNQQVETEIKYHFGEKNLLNKS